MRLIRLNLAILRLSVAALAEPVVLEHRQVLETWVQPLQKRENTCIGVLHQGSATITGTTTCLASQTCCYGGGYSGASSIAMCVPYDALCCSTWIGAVTWCPRTQYCSSGGRFSPTTGCGQILQPTPAIVVTYQPPSSTPTPTQSNKSDGSGSSPLPTGSIIGISVSVACSVLGLAFGIGFKIWSHRRKEKRQQTQAVS